VGRWLAEGVSEGLLERRVKRDGRRGRPPFEYRLTEEGRRRRRATAVPPAVERIRAERLRRWENAKRLREQARADRLAKEAAAQGRVLAMRRRTLTDEEHNVLLAHMILDASKALIAADWNPSAVNAEEARVLTENGLAVPEGDKLVLIEDWLEAFREILHGSRGAQVPVNS
jgi:DNA-binding PadR family transcriptional regulator